MRRWRCSSSSASTVVGPKADCGRPRSGTGGPGRAGRYVGSSPIGTSTALSTSTASCSPRSPRIRSSTSWPARTPPCTATGSVVGTGAMQRRCASRRDRPTRVPACKLPGRRQRRGGVRRPRPHRPRSRHCAEQGPAVAGRRAVRRPPRRRRPHLRSDAVLTAPALSPVMSDADT